MTHDEIQAQLSAYALGVLDPEERAAVDRHLAPGCDECLRELTSWQEVVGALALAGPIETAPDLKPALLRQLQPTPRSAKVIPLRRWTLIPLAVAASALLAVGLARDSQLRGKLAGQEQMVSGLRTELATNRDQLARAMQQLAALERDTTQLRAALAAAQESMAVLQAPGLRMVQLSQTPDAPPARGHVLISPDNGRALFYAFDLAPLPAGKTYELWWITEKDGPVNAGLFQLDRSGLGRVETAVPTAAGTIKAAAVTIEPVGGVEKPTGPMVLLGSV